MGKVKQLTPAELKSIRIGLGLSGADFARLLGYGGSTATMRQMVFDLENNERPIREPQRRLAQAYIDGYRPKDWPV